MGPEVGHGETEFTREFKLEAVRLIKDRGVFDYIERFYNPKRRHSNDRIPEPYGVRAEGRIS